jgi:hypothetical protein
MLGGSEMLETLYSLFDPTDAQDTEVTMEDMGNGILVLTEKRAEGGTAETWLDVAKLIQAARKGLEWYPMAGGGNLFADV